MNATSNYLILRYWSHAQTPITRLITNSWHNCRLLGGARAKGQPDQLATAQVLQRNLGRSYAPAAHAAPQAPPVPRLFHFHEQGKPSRVSAPAANAAAQGLEK